MIYELIAYNTDSRYPDDVRYRSFTSSEKLARLFNLIPKIQFTDSGHGIVFSARPLSGKRLPRRDELFRYVNEQLALLVPTKRGKHENHNSIQR